MKNIEEVLSTLESIVEYIKQTDSKVSSYQLRIEELEKDLIQQREINQKILNDTKTNLDILQDIPLDKDKFTLSMLPKVYHNTVRLNAHLHNYSYKALNSVGFKRSLSSNVKRHHFHKIAELLKQQINASCSKEEAADSTLYSSGAYSSGNLIESAGKELHFKFNLAILSDDLHEVIEKTKHIHKYKIELLDVKEPKLRLWLTQDEIISFLKAKKIIINSNCSEIVDGVVKSSRVVTDFSRLIDIDLPEHLIPVKSKILIAMGDSVTVAGIKHISREERARIGSVAVSFIALQSHLRKRVKGKTLEIISEMPLVDNRRSVDNECDVKNLTIESFYSLIIKESVIFEPTVLLDNDLFNIRDGAELKIEINLEHVLFKYINWLSDSSDKKFLMEFLSLWASMRKHTNSEIVTNKLKISRAVLGKSLHKIYNEKISTKVNIENLPATMLMEINHFNGESLVILNATHPFYEVLLSDIDEGKRENIYRIIFAWAVAENETLSKSVHEALIFSREHLSIYSYDKYDEYICGKLE